MKAASTETVEMDQKGREVSDGAGEDGEGKRGREESKETTVDGLKKKKKERTEELLQRQELLQAPKIQQNRE